MTETAAEKIILREQIHALYLVLLYRPALTAGMLLLSIFAAALEGAGLGFLVPIIEIAQGQADPEEMEGIAQVFNQVYDLLGIPFTLEYVVAGVGFVMILRYTASFLVAWLKVALQKGYVRHLQTEGYERALEARVGYYDEKGSDEVMNGIVTQAEYAGHLISNAVTLFEQGVLSLVYLGVALYIAPVMTILTALLLGTIVFCMRYVAESGYSIGERVADANERIHESAQAGTQGIRDVKLFGLVDELREDFQRATDQYYDASVKKSRNEAAMDNVFQILTALTVFVLIYISQTVASLSVASLGVFLFALFRLAPRMSTLNNTSYSIAGSLPHLVRTHEFIDGLAEQRETDAGQTDPPSRIRSVEFDDVRFSYNSDEQEVLRDVSFAAERGEFVAFVGPSGTGKSTIVSLLMRLYDPDAGRIVANGTNVEEFPLEAWRENVAVVRQQPFIFNDTLRFNVTVGNRDATEREIRDMCERVQVTEFMDDLPNGLDTELGDDGVRLSGGQRQRIAIARALLKDADVLVMDEATSDLDTSLEETIQANIESLEDDRILIVIAHRLSTVVNADRIYVMESGEIVEEGPHKTLLNQSGTYAELYASQ